MNEFYEIKKNIHELIYNEIIVFDINEQ